MNRSIELGKGYAGLCFGESIEQVVEKIGKPTDVEQIGEDVEMPTAVLHYENDGMSLFFETTEGEKLVCINIESPEAELFGEKIIGKSCSEIEKLMKANNITGETRDKEAWGEERISYEDYEIDFYFTDDKVESVTIGK